MPASIRLTQTVFGLAALVSTFIVGQTLAALASKLEGGPDLLVLVRGIFATVVLVALIRSLQRRSARARFGSILALGVLFLAVLTSVPADWRQAFSLPGAGARGQVLAYLLLAVLLLGLMARLWIGRSEKDYFALAGPQESGSTKPGQKAEPDSPYVHDKAKYHYDGEYPEDLPIEQAFVHTGLYLGWLVERGLVSADFIESGEDWIGRFKAREVTGPELYELWDGALGDDMLNEEGNAFSRYYFDFEKGRFLRDYEELLAAGLPSIYHVENSWENYERLRARIDERYAAWKKLPRQRP